MIKCLTLHSGSQMPATCSPFLVPCIYNDNTMDTSRGHMAGGRLLTARDHSRDVVGMSAHHRDSFQQSHTNVVPNLTPRHKPPPRSRGRPGGVEQKEPPARGPMTVDVTLPQGLFLGGQTAHQGNMRLCSQEAMFGLQLTNPRLSNHHPCNCQKVKRSSSSSSGEDDKAVSPSPLSAQLTFVDIFPERQRDSSLLLPPPRGHEVACYENIPVPEIIPLAKSPRPSLPEKKLESVSPDWISDYSRMSGLSTEDGKKLRVVVDRLHISGFYYDSISAQEAKDKLRIAQVGAFLIRRSSQSSHFFALSVKTNRGTTSIRIAFDRGGFRLDADPDSASKMPSFNCVLSLVQYYVEQSASNARNKCVFLESNGRRDTPVILTRPLREKLQPLKHLCRRRLHYYFSEDQLTHLMAQSSPPCSIQTRDYIKSYPYPL